MANILLVEDEPDLATLVSQQLAECGHTVEHTPRGDTGLRLASEKAYDLVIVDRVLPVMDGLTLVQSLRKKRSTISVLFLSALGNLDDRVEGLNSGADDYLAKPFAFSELVARIDALLRRRSGERPVLRAAGLEMDLLRRRVTCDGRDIDLPPREYLLLEYLMRHADRLVTRTMLLEGVWNYNFDPKTNVVETHISRLRSKIGNDLIQTVRGSGYILRSAARG